MTKDLATRARSTLLAMLSFAALITSGLLAVPSAVAASTPQADGVTTHAGYTPPVETTLSESTAHTLDDTLADTNCPDRLACLFTGADYTGIGFFATSDFEGIWVSYAPDGQRVTWRSAKNTFDDRRLQIAKRLADGSFDVVRCLNPNTERPGPFPDGSKWFRIGHLGTRC